MLTANLRLPAFRVPTLDRRHWPATLVLATLLALYLVAGLNVIGMSGIDGRAAALGPSLQRPVEELGPPSFLGNNCKSEARDHRQRLSHLGPRYGPVKFWIGSDEPCVYWLSE